MLTPQAYLVRHGFTTMSPAPEGWLPVPLNYKGRAAAVTAGIVLSRNFQDGNWERPDNIVASDLRRTVQTADIIAGELDMNNVAKDFALRAFNKDVETPDEYEARTMPALNRLIEEPGIPLIVAHRSTSGALDRFYGKHKGDANWSPDYLNYRLFHEGGILAIANNSLIPLFRCIPENFPDASS